MAKYIIYVIIAIEVVDMIGIYKISNTKTDTVYIGQSVNIELRWYQHLRALTNGKHKNAHLQRAFDKYGVDSFTFSVQEQCREEDLTDREQFWIEYYGGADSSNTYNIREATEHGKCPTYIKNKLRVSNGQLVAQYTLDGDFIAVYNSSAEAEEELGISGIRVAWDKNKSAGGFQWRKVSKDDIPLKIQKYRRVGNSGSFRKRQVFKMDDAGKVLETFNSISEVSSIYGFPHQSISEAIKHGRKYRGYYWG